MKVVVAARLYCDIHWLQMNLVPDRIRNQKREEDQWVFEGRPESLW